MNSIWVTSSLCGLGVALGCGSVAGPGSADARSDAPAAVTCAADAAFDPPQPLSGFGTPGVSESAAHFSPDELTMYYGATYPEGMGGFDLYVASRPKLTDPFGVPVALRLINTTAGDLDPSVSADGLSLVFYTSRIANEGFHIYLATRSSLLADFANPIPVSGVAALTVTQSDVTPFLTADGQELWFASNRSGSYDIWHAARAGAGFANPASADALNTTGGVEDLPVLSADRLTIYFTVNRTGVTQNEDIWVAHRAAVTDAFSGAQPVPNINTTAFDHPSWLSPDNCRLYITSNVAGSDDQYVATRHPG